MKKNRTRQKAAAPKHAAAKLKEQVAPKAGITPASESPEESKSKRKWNWRRVVAWAGWVLAVIQFLFWLNDTYRDYSPNISIIDRPSQFPSKSLGTEFVIRNDGRLSVFNLKFSCLINPGRDNGRVEGNSPGQEPLAVLYAGQEITRDCGRSLFTSRMVAEKLEIQVSFDHASIFGGIIQDMEPKRFNVVKGEKGFFATPAD